MKAAVAAFKGDSAPPSVAESSKEQLEVERMKKELARLQEVLMDAPEVERKILKQQVRDLKKYIVRPGMIRCW